MSLFKKEFLNKYDLGHLSYYHKTLESFIFSARAIGLHSLEEEIKTSLMDLIVIKKNFKKIP